MTTTSNDHDLLRSFAASGSDDVFRALVERHLGMVLGVATRRTGSRVVAEEVAQNVFTVLARKASRLKTHTSLTGWLYRTTLQECSDALRRNQAHTRKMNAFSRLATDADSRNVWQDALPVLDEAIQSLSAADRNLITLRFFDRKSFREIASTMGKSEAAAQKQGERALSRLATLLHKRGVVITATVLASGLASQVAVAASGALVQTVSQNALIGASQLSAKILILETIRAMTTGTKLKTAAAVALLAGLPLTMQWNANHELRADVHRLQQELASARVASRANKPRPALAFALPSARRPDRTLSAAAIEPTIVGTSVAQTDSWESALLDADPVRRAGRIARLMEGLTAVQAPMVADMFDRMKKTGVRFAEEYRLFLNAWGRLDGPAAVQRMARPDEKGIVKSTPELLAAMAGWASVNPQSVRAWVEALPEGSQREDVIYGLLDGWSLVDFAGAAAYAQSRPRSPAREHFIELLSERSLATGGVGAAQMWFNNIPNDGHNSVYKSRAFDSVIQAMLYRDPAAAASWIAQSDGQTFVSAGTINKTAMKLAGESPERAMHWMQQLDGFDPMKLRDGQVEVMEKWTRTDPTASGNWLAQQRNDPGYDHMAWRYATTISGTNPQEALAWAGSLADVKDRNAALREVAGYYLKAQGAVAEQYLLQNGFTPDMVSKSKAYQNEHGLDLAYTVEARRMSLDLFGVPGAEDAVVRFFGDTGRLGAIDENASRRELLKAEEIREQAQAALDQEVKRQQPNLQ